MGQAARAGERNASPPSTPNDKTSGQRLHYIQQLGIQKGGNSASFHAHNSFVNSFHEAHSEEANCVSMASGKSSIGDSDDGKDGIDFQMNLLDLKTRDDFRVSFLRKLSYEKVWVPSAQRPPKHQSVIIFDWDDTLLCTSWLNMFDGGSLPQHVWHHLRGIEKLTRQLLEMSLRLGHTFIITNALAGWVEYSAAKWMPGLVPLLQTMRVISARSKYEVLYPDNVGHWKVQAFLDVQRELDSEIITNLNSLGDSDYEMDATHIMGKEFSIALIKTVKFRAHPSPEELLKQLEIVVHKFERIVEKPKNLKLHVQTYKKPSKSSFSLANVHGSTAPCQVTSTV